MINNNILLNEKPTITIIKQKQRKITDYFTKGVMSNKNEKIKNKTIYSKTGKELNAIVFMCGDGSCLFRSLSYGLFKNQDFHNIVRRVVVSFVFENWGVYVERLTATNVEKKYETAKEYLEDMQRDGVFGTDFEIAVFSNIFKITVNIYRIDEENSLYLFYSTNTDPEYKEEINIFFSGGERAGHFDIICNYSP